jgi:uncharacterized protein (TIGR02466 family)
MQLLELFPTMVGVFECEALETSAAAWKADIATAIREREVRAGKAQHQTDDRLHERPGLAGLMDFFRGAAAQYMEALKYSRSLELRLQCCWATLLKSADRFEMHQHANSFLSGAFYPDVEETAKPLLFRDPRPQNRTFDIPVEEELRINRRYYAVAPSNGRLILFPSWLEHRVRPSMTDHPRMSVSFNMTLHGEVGSSDELTRATL